MYKRTHDITAVSRAQSPTACYRSAPFRVLSLALLIVCLLAAGNAIASIHKQAESSISQQQQPVITTMFQAAMMAFVEEDFKHAYKRLLPLAHHGMVEAQYYLASLYDHGHGTEMNAALAAHWYTRAAQQGHLSAQYNLGVAYANGHGVQKDLVSAIRWWRQAGRAGSVNAQFNLGIMYLHGKGIRRDPSEAVVWWKMAAEQGDAVAQYNLGALYANGQGVDRNVQLALTWWNRAALQGFEQAIIVLREFDKSHAATSAATSTAASTK